MKNSGPGPRFALPPGATLEEWFRHTEKLLLRAGAALGQTAGNPHDEALALLFHALQLPLDSGPQVLKKRLSERQRAAAAEFLRRRIEDRVPVAYLAGEAWLGGERFQVDERVLIPRSYFVEIIPRIESFLGGARHFSRLVDVGTGSGCLAILLARHFPKARVDAMDVDAGALEVARLNVAAHRLGRRLHLFQSDVFDSLPPARYDLILSNPPYEPTARVDALSPEFQKEPRLALDGGPDGLAIVRKLIRQSRERLKKGGALLIEVGGLRRAIDREFAALQPIWLPTADGSDCICLIRASDRKGRSRRGD